MAQAKLTEAEIERTRRVVTKHKGNTTKAAKEMGMSRSAVQNRMKAAQRNGAVLQPKAGRSLAEFRAAHDKNFIVPAKIRDALKALGDGWEYEAQFIRLAGVSQTDMGSFRDQFAEHVVVVDRTKRVWAGTKATANKLREMVN